MKQIIGALTAGALLTAWGMTAMAQSDTPGTQREDKLESLAEQQGGLIEEDVESLSGEQKLQQAQKKIESAKDNLGQTEKLLKEAREDEKDIMKINCINDKQAAIKGFLKVAEQSYVKLKEGVEEGDQKEADHHYTLVAIAEQKIDGLTQEARLCAGDVTRYADETSVEVNVDDRLPDDPEYTSPEGEGLGTLPELTPYQ